MVRATFILFLQILLTFSAFAGEPLRVALLDSPVDYKHSMLRGYIDEPALRALKYVDEDGVEHSWFDLNEDEKGKIRKTLRGRTLPEQLDAIDMLAMLAAPEGELSEDARNNKHSVKALIMAVAKQKLSGKYAHELEDTALYAHGTHVAGIVVKALKDLQLLNFPFIDETPYTEEEITRFNAETERRNDRALFEQITRAFQQYDVRVVNMSAGFGDDEFETVIRHDVSSGFARNNRALIRQVAHEAARISFEELARFISENRKAVFVLSAGNDGADIDKIVGQGKIISPAIVAPNLIKVGSLNRDGELSRFSNYSPKFVDIAVAGEGILSARIGGGRLFMTGTSMSAPRIANRVASILIENPALSAEEAIAKLYQDHCDHRPDLRARIAEGRVLKPLPRKN